MSPTGVVRSLLRPAVGVVHAFIPQSHRPGAEAEVDFGDVKVRPAGELVTCFVFARGLSYSGKSVHRVFACDAARARAGGLRRPPGGRG